MGRGLQNCAALAAVVLCAAACASTPSLEMAPRTVEANVSVATSGDGPSIVRPAKATSCVPFVREHSGIALYGDAYTWWDQAHGRYGQYTQPQLGSVMVLIGYAGPKHGHLAIVRRIVSEREIRVDHANWMNDGNLYLNTPVFDVSNGNTWTQVRVWDTRDGHLGASTYRVQGFIAPTRVAGS